MKHVNDVYEAHLLQVMNEGSPVVSRGFSCHEIIGKTLTWPLNSPMITLTKRKLNYKFMMSEAAWILSGRNDLDYISRFMKRYANYSDDGIHLAGAYGPPIIDQLPYILRCLNEDPGTRQAVLTIWRPRPAPSLDIPCTCVMQFFIRDGFLHMMVSMRSSDAWLGIPYDLFSFSMVAYVVAASLNKAVALGDGYLVMGSSHIYERDLESVRDLLSASQAKGPPREVRLEPAILAARTSLAAARFETIRELEALTTDVPDPNAHLDQFTKWVNRRLGLGTIYAQQDVNDAP